MNGPPLQQNKSLESIAQEGGISIANSILSRVKEFPKREGSLQSWMKRGLESVPSQILWEGLEDEAAPVFVLYKMLHEAFSNSPHFFRRFITDVMAAQPTRFSKVFSRETLWSVIARVPGLDIPEDWSSPGCIRAMLECLNEKGFWRRSDEELERDSQSIAALLNNRKTARFRQGVQALRRLQTERATALTRGNVMLFVPAKLNQYVTDIAELGMRGALPGLKEMSAKVHEVVRDPVSEGRHQSVPIDVLFTELNGDILECFILVREKETQTKQMELRKKSLLVRYFLKYAFTAYEIDKLKVRLAFYLDRATEFVPLAEPANLFHPEELISFHDFWQNVAGTPTGVGLVHKARNAAADELRKNKLMDTIRAHILRDRAQRPNATTPQKQSYFFGAKSCRPVA